MQGRTSRQTVTGLVVNSKVNVSKDYYLTARAMCETMFRYGWYYRQSDVPDQDKNKLSSHNELEGILSHICFIKEQEERRRHGDKAPMPKGIANLYERFAFFRHFVNLHRPLLVCEGKTDGVYLKCAIRKLKVYQPILGAQEDDKFVFNIGFFNYLSASSKRLQIRGGSGEMVRFISTYKQKVSRYKYAPMRHPVVILIDNDDGASDIFSALRKLGIAISLESAAPFYRISHNLYLVKTLENGKEQSRIEDLFDKELFQEKLEGKSFNPSKEHEADSEYGKVAFAERIIRQRADSIDFSKFSTILDRLVAVLDHHSSVVASSEN